MKRIRLFGRRERGPDERFTSIAVYAKTRELIRAGASKDKVPIYQYVHNIVMLAQNKPKGGQDERA